MNKTLVRTLGISAATATLALFAFTYAAQAQAPGKEPAKKRSVVTCKGQSYANCKAPFCTWVAVPSPAHCVDKRVPIDKSPPKQ